MVQVEGTRVEDWGPLRNFVLILIGCILIDISGVLESHFAVVGIFLILCALQNILEARK